jgi:hypothetical protein
MLRLRAEEEISSGKAKRNRKVTSVFARDLYFMEQLDERLRGFFGKGKLVIPTYKAKKKEIDEATGEPHPLGPTHRE